MYSKAPVRLPPGRHRLTREQVHASQRERVLAAIIDQVGARGLSETTVAHVIGSAKVSRSAFYEQFPDKGECFRVAYRELTGTLVSELAAIGSREETFLDGVRRNVETYLGWCRERPNAARAWHLGIVALEPDGLELRDEAIAVIEGLFRAGARRARLEYPSLPPLRDFMLYAATQASLGLVSREIRSGRIGTLDELADSLDYLWLVALADSEIADAGRAGSK